jgi:glycerate 2-kinase
VDSPLLGEHGAARSFAPQKGASPSEVSQLEAALTHFVAVVADQLSAQIERVPSGGAAGGIAAGLHGVLGARLSPGVDWVLDAIGFDGALDGASLCITAEGLLDRQSLRNKGVLGVARRSAARGIPVVALAGAIANDVADSDFPELAASFSICSRPMPLTEAMRDAGPLLERAAERVVRLFSQATKR